MEWKEFKTKVLAIALNLGCSDAEVVIRESEQSNVLISEETVQSLTQSHTGICMLRVIYADKVGFATTEVADAAQVLVAQAIANAKVNEKDELIFMANAQTYRHLSMPENKWQDKTVADKISKIKQAEQNALKIDERLEKSEGVELGTTKSSLIIANTRGLFAESLKNRSLLYAGFISKDGAERRFGYHYNFCQDEQDLNSIVDIAAQHSLNKLGAKPVSTGNYDVILRGPAIGALFSVLSNIFNAKEVLQGRSSWAEKLGMKVASEVVTLVDNPHNESNPVVFDDEGLPTQYTEIVKDGILKSFLHNSATAAKFKVETTANAALSGGGDLDVAPSNLTLQPGQITINDLQTQIGKGLVINEFDGIGSGVNAVSGDFSLLAEGYYFENGKYVNPVNQITLAANFFDLLQNIQAVTNELSPAFGMVMTWSPSVYAKNLKITGV